MCRPVQRFFVAVRHLAGGNETIIKGIQYAFRVGLFIGHAVAEFLPQTKRVMESWRKQEGTRQTLDKQIHQLMMKTNKNKSRLANSKR